MQLPTAIVIGSTIIGGCILTTLGYSVSRDLAAHRELERQATATAERLKKVRSKEAWRASLKFVDVELGRWLEAQAKPGRLFIAALGVKMFDVEDIEWKNEHDVRVHSLVGASLDKDSNPYVWYSLSCWVHLRGDGVDYEWRADAPLFQFITLTKEQEQNLRFIPVYDYRSFQDVFTSPLIRSAPGDSSLSR